MKLLSSTLIASMLLNGIILPVSARATEEQQVCATAGRFTPEVKTEPEIKAKCGQVLRAGDCVTTRKAIAKWDGEYKELAKKACEKHQAALSEIKQLNQSSSFNEIKNKAEAGIADINALLTANQKILDAIPGVTAKNVEALKEFSVSHNANETYRGRMNEIGTAFSPSTQFLETMKKDVLRATDNSGISGNEAKASEAQIKTLAQSQSFVRALLTDKEKNEAAIRELTQARDNAAKNVKNTKTADDDKTKKDDGFSPMSLLPLAAPLAGLLMQQKKQDSGLSDPTTPTNPYANQPPASAAGTSFDSKTGQNPTGMTIGSSKSPETGMNMPAENYAASSGALEPFQGDISNGAGDGKSSNMGAMGSYSANSGGGSSDSSGASATPGKDRKPANIGALPPAEDGLIGAGGGGNFGSHSAEASAESGSGMKDMLQDMESTLEDSPSGLFAEVENQNSPDGVAAENSESLFPRVRACLVRNLKKGFVLNGLGEKLPESESH